MKTIKTVFLFGMMVFSLILMVGGCSSRLSSPLPSLPIEPEVKEINLQGGSFYPVSLTIKAGDTVRWENNCCSGCSVTSDNGLFDSGKLNRGQSFSFTFINPGIYPYHCIKIEEMKGTIIVQ